MLKHTISGHLVRAMFFSDDCATAFKDAFRSLDVLWVACDCNCADLKEKQDEKRGH